MGSVQGRQDRRHARATRSTFVNEETVTVGNNVFLGNAGLSTVVAPTGLYAKFSAVPAIQVPAFKSTRTLADQLALSATGTIRGVDEGIQPPHIHQVSAGISREIMWNMAVEARYVGTFGRDIFRGIDLNQMNTVGAMGGAFLQDFTRGRQNGYFSQAAGGAFNPAYTGPGSQPLTVLPQFGQLANATVRSAIQQNQPARLVDHYISQPGRGGQRRVSAEPRHLRGGVGPQRRVQQLQRAAARAAPPVPPGLRRADQLHVE